MSLLRQLSARPLFSASPHTRTRAMMTSRSEARVYFGPFDVTPQVFHGTPLSFALVNLKPLLPGHVLVSPRRRVARLTDLTTAEVADLFATVRHVQRMLARTYFDHDDGGSFNIAVQDGPDAGQSVPHVHCHVIPRRRDDGQGDGIYDRLASEEGNVGGALRDADRRPGLGGQFPRIEDAAREPRSPEVMATEARFFRDQMTLST